MVHAIQRTSSMQTLAWKLAGQNYRALQGAKKMPGAKAAAEECVRMCWMLIFWRGINMVLLDEK